MPVAETDLALLRRFEEGDQAAFSEIVRRYAGMVFSICRRIVGDRARAEEISQETFYKLMTRPASVSQSLGGWLHRAATRLAVDERRSDTARRRREAQAAVDRVEADGSVPDDSGPRWADVSPHIDEALTALPEDSRDLLVRHFLRGAAQQDLATAANTSAATLSRRMKLAVDLLRREMRRRGIDIAPSLLAGLFARHGLESASASLIHELGKMAMVSGMRALARTAAAHWTARAAATFRSTFDAGWPIASGMLTSAIITALVLLMRPGIFNPAGSHVLPIHSPVKTSRAQQP
ncbi:MAG TPA: RNA polymerase sigma factor [Tepidisphaeraceae bacterium]|nr:RNA polymerase sigma factor [Tepidisphaeraceae bacterium]